MKIATVKFDTLDRAILLELQRDGRLANSDLAERVGLSPSACLRRVRLLEERGLISAYAAILEPRACGLPGTAFIHITLEQQGRTALDTFERAVARVPEILECHLLAGQADYLMRVVYRDAGDLERIHSEILTQLPGVTRVQSTLTLRAVKKATALPI